MGIFTWVVVAAVILAVLGLGVGTFVSGVWRGAEVIGNNSLVQNATSPVRDLVGDNAESEASDGVSKNEGDGNMVELTTSKPTYRQGEPVTLVVKNNGNEPVDFPNATMGLEITNTDTGEKIPILSATVLVSLDAGKSAPITLALEGGDGQPAKAGNYIAEVYTTPRGDVPAATVTFEII